MKKLKKINAQLHAHRLGKVSSAVCYRSNECRTSVIDNKDNRMKNTIETQITSSLDNMVEENKPKAPKKIPYDTLRTMVRKGHITEETAQIMIASNLACGSSKSQGGKGQKVLAVLNTMNDLTEKQTRAKQLLEKLNKTIDSINEPEILEVYSSIHKGIGKLSANWAKK